VLILQRDLSQPLKLDDVDASSSVLIPFYDHDTRIVYLAGKVRHTLSLSTVYSPVICCYSFERRSTVGADSWQSVHLVQ